MELVGSGTLLHVRKKTVQLKAAYYVLLLERKRLARYRAKYLGTTSTLCEALSNIMMVLAFLVERRWFD